jgi:hypothetical protein
MTDDRIERRFAALEARIDQLADVVSKLWQRIDRPAPKPPAPPPAADAQVPAAKAARALGVHVKTVKRLISSGKLKGRAAPLSGDRRHWTASAADLDRLVAEKSTPVRSIAPESQDARPTRASVRS